MRIRGTTGFTNLQTFLSGWYQLRGFRANRSQASLAAHDPENRMSMSSGLSWHAATLLTLVAVAGACADGVPQVETGVNMDGGSPAASVVFTIPEPDLLPENVAYDRETGAYFVGSTRKGKILRILAGEVTEFRPARADGLWMVIGMKVDPVRRVLWVCSSQGENLAGDTLRDGRAAGLFRFHLDTGALLDRWLLDAPGETHFLNDLVLAADGTAFVTHMFGEGAIWTAAPGGELLPFVTLSAESYPNGIALSTDGEALYAATSHGIVRIDVRDRSVVALGGGEAERAAGLDGLYLAGNALVGIRPDPAAVLRFDLDDSGRTIHAVTTLIDEHPAFHGPTTGVVVGDELHFVANAQFGLVADDGTLPPASDLADPVILAIPLAADTTRS